MFKLSDARVRTLLWHMTMAAVAVTAVVAVNAA